MNVEHILCQAHKVAWIYAYSNAIASWTIEVFGMSKEGVCDRGRKSRPRKLSCETNRQDGSCIGTGKKIEKPSMLSTYIIEQ